jgi:hypothetical protein
VICVFILKLLVCVLTRLVWLVIFLLPWQKNLSFLYSRKQGILEKRNSIQSVTHHGVVMASFSWSDLLKCKFSHIGLTGASAIKHAKVGCCLPSGAKILV